VKVKNGKIVLPDGMQYEVLVLPDEKSIRLELLELLEKLVTQGMVLIGPKPEKATGLSGYPESDAKVKQIALRMWGPSYGNGSGENRVGKGKVIWGKTPRQVLESMGVGPDFSCASSFPDTHLEYIHRSTGAEDLYFVVNRLARHGINDTKYRYLTDLPDRYEEVNCLFRITGKVPELWDPLTGKIEKIAVYREENGYTMVPLHLTPEGSVFVVFRDRKPERHIQSLVRDHVNIFPSIRSETGSFPIFDLCRRNDSVKGVFWLPGKYQLEWSDGTRSELSVNDTSIIKTIHSPWTLTFEQKWGPSGEMKIDSLFFWTESRDSLIRYYSGKALYTNVFHLLAEDLDSRRLYLDLGNVQEIASVKINGKEAGVTWIAPFRLNITGLVKEGENRLEVTVVNSWVNRLIGDSYLPVAKRYTRTNVMKFEGADRESYMRKSGLSGNVMIISVKETIVN